MDSDSEKLKAQLDAALQQLQQANAEKAELQRRLAPPYLREPAPNWVAWKAVPGVALWEAVALSLGIEPSDRVLQTIQAGPQQTHRFQRSGAPPEIFERLQHCKRALSMSGPIVPQSLYAGARWDSKCPVLLSEVATFLQSAGFAIPQELDGLTAPDIASAPAEVQTEQQEAAVDKRLVLPEDPKEKRAMLLEQFRSYGGKRRHEPGKKGARGALARLERATGIDDKNLGQMLDKAIEEKRAAELWGQLNKG
jgi:hypothetical protein